MHASITFGGAQLCKCLFFFIARGEVTHSSLCLLTTPDLQESFSEDPFLTGKLAASYIRGLQSKKVAATIKHFVGNEQETERKAYDAVIAERPLREIYLKPFEIAVREASPWALMSSYNIVNGVHADENLHTLREILRGEWEWNGAVISDWTGTYATG